MRTGIGYDIHRLVPTLTKNSLPIGGVAIPCHYEVKAHSDGDVLLHAVVDAMLGALALGDIGSWFSDSKPEHKNRPSSQFVEKVMAHISQLGWRVIHLDSIIFLEEPKLSPHSDAIRRQIAQLLKVDLHSISVKAKTMEGIGAIGSREAIAAQAIVTLEFR